MEQTIAAFKRIENSLGDDTFKLPTTYGDLNRQQILLEGLRAGKATFQDGLKHKHSVFEYTTHLFSLGNANPLGLTGFLFTPFLKLVGTIEQVEYWLPLAESGQITGSYAQTEMSNGTQVGGIETIATFDRETDEFDIHSPSLTSVKYCEFDLSDKIYEGVYPFVIMFSPPFTDTCSQAPKHMALTLT